MQKVLTRRVQAFWLIPPACAAIGATVGWWLELRPAAAEWGTVSSWVATVGGLAALTIAARQLRFVLLQRRQAMGDSIGVILEPQGGRGDTKLKVEIVNAGQFGVHGVRTVVVEQEGGRWTELSAAQEPRGGVVVPGASAPVYHDWRPAVQGAMLGVRVTFLDVEGRSWSSVHTLDGQRLRLSGHL
jgi:hypothetical protein